MNTDRLGAIAESIAVKIFLKKGYTVSIPFNKEKYDMIIDLKPELIKIQVKKATIKKDYLYFRTVSSGHQYTKEEIDYFAVVDIDSELMYLIKIEHCSKEQQRLRLVPTKNNQRKNIFYAEDYKLRY